MAFLRSVGGILRNIPDSSRFFCFRMSPSLRYLITRPPSFASTQPKNGGGVNVKTPMMTFSPKNKTLSASQQSGKKIPFFVTEKGKTARMYTFAFAISLCMMTSVLNYSAWSMKILDYYEHPETQIQGNFPIIKMESRQGTEKFYFPIGAAELLQVVITDFGVREDRIKRIVPYVTDTLEPVTLGSLKSRSKCQIGLPYYAAELGEDTEEVDLSKIRHRCSYHPLVKLFRFGFDLDETTLRETLSEDEILELKQTFVLSLKAKKFVLARCLKELYDKQTFILMELIPMLSMAFLYLTIEAFLASLQRPNAVMRRFLLKRGENFMMFYIIAVFFVFAAVLYTSCNELKAKLRERSDVAIDTAMVERLGPDYCAGGCEYYDKALRRNLLLRKGLVTSSSNVGSNFITPEGDLIPYWYELTSLDGSKLRNRLKTLQDQFTVS